MKKRKIISILAVIGIIILLLAVFRAFQITGSKEKDEGPLVKKVPVKAVTAKITDLNQGDAVNAGRVLFRIDRDVIGMQYQLASVESPISGYVASIYANRGMSVSPSVPVAEIVNQQNVECVVQIMEEDINTVTIGAEALIRVNSFPDRVFKGKVYKKSPVLDQLSRTQEVRITIDNESLELRHGMFADVEIITGVFSGVLVVPADSLFEDRDNELSAFIVKEEKAVKVAVRKKDEIGFHAVIESGISEGDVVITLGHENVNDGDELLVYTEDY